MKNDEEEYKQKILAQTDIEIVVKLGKACELRSNWEMIKVEIAYLGCLARISQNPKLITKLMATEDKVIVYQKENDFWNKWNCIILTRIRSELRLTTEDNAIVKGCKELRDFYKKSKENKIKKSLYIEYAILTKKYNLILYSKFL
jgi:predicted NAD-dependent protein-ADP-ribosyltransferase YbiA (DUF1768 family)